VQVNGSYVDPLKLAPQRGQGVSKAQMPQFLADIAGVGARLDHAAVPAAAAAAPVPAPIVPIVPTIAHTN
jgi:hypothetical protein